MSNLIAALDRLRRPYPVLAGLLLLGAGMSSCFLRTSPSDAKTKPQEWRESRGPVIPHDTFPRDCTICHEKGSWTKIRADFVFDHAKETGTPLNFAHADAQCLRCHNDRGSVANFAKRGCTGCHEDIHRGRLGIKCTTCHGENDWNPTGVYAVHAQTRFPLIGVHVGVTCSRCHPSAESGQFVGADPRCESCHRQDAISAKSMDHAAQGLLTNCQQCHTQTAWGSATFNHAGITSGCIRCHQNDLAVGNASVPNHSTFGTNCEACHHSFTTWSGATFNHTAFPMNHRNAGGVCATCHPAAGNFTVFTCVTASCHNNPGQLQSDHNGVKNYVYSNTSCYSCHPQGNAGRTIPQLKLKPKK